MICQNNTYGKINNKFYFKCIPDDRSLPSFLIPYQVKNNSFCKVSKTNTLHSNLSHGIKTPHGELLQLLEM